MFLKKVDSIFICHFRFDRKFLCVFSKLGYIASPQEACVDGTIGNSTYLAAHDLRAWVYFHSLMHAKTGSRKFSTARALLLL